MCPLLPDSGLTSIQEASIVSAAGLDGCLKGGAVASHLRTWEFKCHHRAVYVELVWSSCASATLRHTVKAKRCLISWPALNWHLIPALRSSALCSVPPLTLNPHQDKHLEDGWTCSHGHKVSNVSVLELHAENPGIWLWVFCVLPNIKSCQGSSPLPM